jgi:hypothetical protein
MCIYTFYDYSQKQSSKIYLLFATKIIKAEKA